MPSKKPKMKVFWTLKSVRADKVKGVRGISRTPAIPVLNMPIMEPGYEIIYDNIGCEVLTVITDETITLNMADENDEDYDCESFDCEFIDGIPVRPE